MEQAAMDELFNTVAMRAERDPLMAEVTMCFTKLLTVIESRQMQADLWKRNEIDLADAELQEAARRQMAAEERACDGLCFFLLLFFYIFIWTYYNGV